MPRLRVKVEDRWYDVDVGPWEGDRVRVLVDEEPVMVFLEDLLQAKDAATAEADIKPDSTDEAGDNAVRSPLPGVILSIDVGVGDRVSAGGRICVLEAMKMEQELTASRSGKVEGGESAEGSERAHRPDHCRVGVSSQC